MRVEIKPTDTPLDLLDSTGISLDQLLCQQRYRYEDLRRDLNLTPNAPDGFGPVINVQSLDYSVTFAGQHFTVYNLTNSILVDDLAFVLYDRGAGHPLQLELGGNPERYTPESLSAHATRLTHLLEQIAADPATPLHRLEILTAEERHRLVHAFNDTDAPFPEATLIERFEQQVAKTPEQTALLFEDQALTYAELDARANRLAWMLIARGIGPEDIVALCLDRSPELVIALLATLKTGAAYLPLDPDYPSERLAFLLGDADPRGLLTTSALCSRLPDWQHRLCLDASAVLEELDALPVAAPDDTNRTTPLRPQHPAYLIYTSGSTGTPKGVAVTNTAVSNSIFARSHFYAKNIKSLIFFIVDIL